MSLSQPARVRFPIDTDLRCGTCARKFGWGHIEHFVGRLEVLCTRRSRHEACMTMNVYTGTEDGYLEHEFSRVAERGDG